MRTALPIIALTALVAMGCKDDEPDVTPIVATGPRPPPMEGPSEYVTNPHANLRERSAAERGREQAAIEREANRTESGGGGGGGGGGGPDFHPQPADPPTGRELEQYRRELGEQMGANVDATEDPCEQFRDVWRSTVRAQDEPGRQRPNVPSRREVLSPCRDLPRGLQQCLDHTYFNQHMDECNDAFQTFGRRGNRISRNAERQLEAARANGGMIDATPSRPPADEASDLPVVPDALLERDDEEDETSP